MKRTPLTLYFLLLTELLQIKTFVISTRPALSVEYALTPEDQWGAINVSAPLSSTNCIAYYFMDGSNTVTDTGRWLVPLGL